MPIIIQCLLQYYYSTRIPGSYTNAQKLRFNLAYTNNHIDFYRFLRGSNLKYLKSGLKKLSYTNSDFCGKIPEALQKY